MLLISAIRQTDLKRIIAYSSVAHMNLVTLGIFSFNIMGIEGSILQSISHGFVAGGMFFLNRYCYMIDTILDYFIIMVV